MTLLSITSVITKVPFAQRIKTAAAISVMDGIPLPSASQVTTTDHFQGSMG